MVASPHSVDRLFSRRVVLVNGAWKLESGNSHGRIPFAGKSEVFRIHERGQSTLPGAGVVHSWGSWPGISFQLAQSSRRQEKAVALSRCFGSDTRPKSTGVSTCIRSVPDLFSQK